MALQSVIGPGLCSLIVIRFGLAGWAGIGMATVVASLALGPVARAARRSVQG
jgi:hypothetical protein